MAARTDHLAGYPRATPLRNVPAAEHQIELPAAGLFRLDGDQRGKVLTCRAGALWITQQGDSVDYLLKAGDLFVVTSPGRVVVQALRPATLHVAAPWAGVPA